MERKERILQIRLSEAERARAQQLAQITDSSVSELIRSLLKDARVVVVPRVLEIGAHQHTNDEIVLA